MKSKWLVLAFALLLFSLCAPARTVEAFDFTYNLRSMIQRNPDFSTYSETGARGPDGVIWLKRVDIGVAPEGGVERQTMWILLAREGLPPRWLSWNIPVPKGGTAEFLEASVYSVPDAEKIGTAIPGPTFGDTIRSAAFSGLPEEFILVVHYREVFPEKLSVDDLVWTSESLPVWETAIRVTVPAGHPFYYFSSPNHTPQEVKVNDRTAYEWHVLNTAAEVSPSIRVADREYVVFGSRGDRRNFARFIRGLEGVRLPPPPQAVRDMSGRRRDAKFVENVLSWLYEQPGIVLTSEPREVPAEAPWTAREKLLLAHNWLKEAVVSARLFWRLPYAPGNDRPACEAAIVDPLLEVSLPDSKSGAFYFDMERPPRAGGNGPLFGGIVYGIAQGVGDNLEERVPPPQKAAENRLSARFNLSLSESGIMTGTIQITARNAWRQFLFPGKPTSGDLADWMKNMFTQVPRYSDVTFRETRTENVVTVTLSGTQMIRGTEGSHIMTSPPPLVPKWFGNLSSGPFPYSLNFPFVMEAKLTLALPASTVNALLPPQVAQGAGKIRYSESHRLDKRKRFLAEAQITVDTTSISGTEATRLNEALWNWRAFMTHLLPVQLRAR